jgi:hypothetical protein
MADVPTVDVSGPLGPFTAGFVDDMRRPGFGPVAVRKQTGQVAGLSGWLMNEDLAPAGPLLLLTPSVSSAVSLDSYAAGSQWRVPEGPCAGPSGFLDGL